MPNQHTKKKANDGYLEKRLSRAHVSMKVGTPTAVEEHQLGRELAALFRKHRVAVHDVQFSEPELIVMGNSLQSKVSAPQPATTEAELPGGIDRLDGALNCLHSTVEMLEKRLAPVTRSQPPTDGAGATELAPEQTHVGQRLRSLESRVWMLNGILNSVLQRLEV